MDSISTLTRRQLLNKVILLTSDSSKSVALSAVDALIDSADYRATDWGTLLLALNSPHEEVKAKIIDALENNYGKLSNAQKNEFISYLINLAKNKPASLALSVTEVLVAIAKEHKEYSILLRLLGNPYKNVVQKAYTSLIEAWEDREAVRAVKEYVTHDDAVKQLLREIKTGYNKAYYHSAVTRALEVILFVPILIFEIIYFISPILIIALAVLLYWNSYQRRSSTGLLSGLIGLIFYCFIPILTAISVFLLGTSNDDELKSKAVKFSIVALLWMSLYWLSRL